MKERLLTHEIRQRTPDRDVIVVGSGPAGSAAAITLALAGKDVLLVDKESFPRDKPCGDGIPSSSTRFAAKHLGLDLHSIDIVRHEITGTNIIVPNGVEIGISSSRQKSLAFTSPRESFDNGLRRHAIEVGAEFDVEHIVGPLITDVQGNRVDSFTPGDWNQEYKVEGVITRDNREITSKVVIAADGAQSKIAEALRGRASDREERAVAIRAYAELEAPIDPKLYIYFYDQVLPGYGWIFPVGERRVNIGIGIFDLDAYKATGKNAEHHLLDFIDKVDERFPMNIEDGTVKGWPIPCWVSPESRVVNDVYLVGDAGRFVEKLTGAGIHDAMVSGMFAAQAAIMRLDGESSKNAARHFNWNVRKHLEPSYRLNLLAQKHLIRHPGRLNFVANRLNNLPSPLQKKFVQLATGSHT